MDDVELLNNKLAIQTLEFNWVFLSILENIRIVNWKYIKDKHPKTFKYILEQLSIVNT